jgi:hypothetical protein
MTRVVRIHETGGPKVLRVDELELAPPGLTAHHNTTTARHLITRARPLITARLAVMLSKC